MQNYGFLKQNFASKTNARLQIELYEKIYEELCVKKQVKNYQLNQLKIVDF